MFVIIQPLGESLCICVYEHTLTCLWKFRLIPSLRCSLCENGAAVKTNIHESLWDVSFKFFRYICTSDIPELLDNSMYLFVYLFPSPFPHLWKGVAGYHPLTWYHTSLAHQIFVGLGASSPTEDRQGSPLLLMCWEPWTNLCMLFGWWLSLWELPGVQVSWHFWSSGGVAIPFSSVSPSPNSSTGVPDLSLNGCTSQSAARRASQRIAMRGSCLQVQYTVSHSVRVWCLPVAWIPSWASYWSATPSVSAPFLYPLHLRIKQDLPLFLLEFMRPYRQQIKKVSLFYGLGLEYGDLPRIPCI